MGWQPLGHADQGQALHRGRPVRPLADQRSAAILPASARRAQRPVPARRHSRQRDPERGRQARADRDHPHDQGPGAAARRPADRRRERRRRAGADPAGAQAGRAGDFRGGFREGQGVRHRAARHPLQADQL